MNQKIRKTALLMGACSLLGMYSPVTANAESSVQAVQQATKKVTGTVSDAMGPVIGASVVEKGNTGNGVVTDFDGNFTINVKPGATLVISYIGFTTQEIAVGNQSNISVTLKEDNALLDEVVVVGYGVQKKKLVTGATVEVKGEDIAKLNTTQVLGALQSQSPGVSIQAVGGQPGDGFKVSIRGAGTNGDTKPLYVIDGVAGGDINNLNPADIERVDVLKDAASCAIYGSAAANGVILVTTKQGKEGSIEVSYDGNIGWQNIYRLPQMLTAKEYMQVIDIATFNSGEAPINWANYFKGQEALLESYQNGTNPGTDWIDALRNKNAITTSHSMNIAGGGSLSKFSMGVGYQYQDGTFGGEYAKSDFRRLTLRLNSEHVIYRNSEGLDVIKVGENIYYGHKQTQGIQQGNMYGNTLSYMMRAIPLIPIYNADGDFFGYNDVKGMGMFNYNAYISNPLAALTYTSASNNKSVSRNLNTVGYVEIQPIKGLIYRGQVSYNTSTWSYRSFSPTYQLTDQTGGYNLTSSAFNQIGQGWSWGMTHTLNYRFDLSDHHFDVLAGTEYSESRPNFGFSLEATATNAITPDLNHAYMALMKDNNAQATVSGWPYGDSRGLSYFGRLNYDFAEKYMLSAIIRADGSSVFAPGHRWGYFPSFSAGWVVSNENFLKDSNWLSFLKLRAGWGQNGNKNNVSAFAYEAAFVYDAFSMYSFGNAKDTPTKGASLSRLKNEELTWETSEQINVGFDARFLAGKLSLTADWYQKTTKDLILDVPVSPTTGFSTQKANAGTVRNRGIEVALNWRDRIGSDFEYSIGYNIAYNKNEVTKVNSSQKYNNGGNNLLAMGTGYMARFEEGQPIGYFWGYKTAGPIQNAAELAAYTASLKDGDPANSLQGTDLKVGDLRFVDTNGDGIINADDKTYLGDPNPDVTMGLTLGANWKGFDLNVTGYAALGQQVARSYRNFADSYYENYTTEVFDYWNGEGTSDKYPKFAYMNRGMNWQSISDLYIEDGDYFRLQNLTVGYDFAHTLLKKSLFQQLRIYFAAQNLFTITNYKGMDPENGRAISSEPWITGVDLGNYPQPRTYLVGVNIKFKGKDAPKAEAKTVYVKDDAEIARLNGELNQLRAELDACRNRAPETKVIKEENVLTFPYLVNFVINKTDVVNREQVNLETIAQMIKAAPGKKFNVIGYADNTTGTPEINTQLAQTRAQNVYDILVNQFGVSRDSLVLDSKGGVDNMYLNDPQLSRSVVISEVK